MADNPDIVIGHDTPPPLDRVNPVHSFERGLDPWHEDAFPDEFKASAPNRGKRQSGWLALDWCGNVIGFSVTAQFLRGRTMAETKFTPGPWKAARDEFGQMIVECPQSKLITLLLPDDNENYADDAHLIAAAPDLYEALELILELRSKELGEWLLTLNAKHLTLKEYAQAALAKARGEENGQG